jgi:hypothetical protein
MRSSLFLCLWFHHYERLLFIITRDYTSSLREIAIHHYERLHFNITRDFTSSLREIALVFQLHTSRLYLLSVYIYGGCFYSLDAHDSPVNLYPLRYRRSILTALMRSSLFLCLWFHHYESLHFNIMRDRFSISITHQPSIFTIGLY